MVKKLKITNEMASKNILAAATEGRLTQRAWHGTGADGKELACLLGSIHPRVKKAEDCNGNLMPLWMAEVTVTLFDKLHQNDIDGIGLRYGKLIGMWDVIDEAGWGTILNAFLVRVIDEAMDVARPVSEGKSYWPAIENAVAECRRVVVEKDATAAKSATYAAAKSATYAAANAANSAAYAANSAAYTATYANSAATYATAATYAATYAANSAAYAAERAMALKLFTFLLDQIEAGVNSTK